METTLKKLLVDANGVSLKILEDKDLGEYINIKEATQCGLQLFSSVDLAHRHLISELEIYLNAQAGLFLNVRGLKHEIGKDIIINVQLRNQRSPSGMSKNTFYREREQKDYKTQTSNVHSSNASFQSNHAPKYNNNYSNRNNEYRTPPTANANSSNLPRKINSPACSLPDLNFIPNESKPPTPKELINKLNNVETSTPNLTKPEETSTPKLTKLEEYPKGCEFVQKIGGLKDLMVQVLKILSPTAFVCYIVCEQSMKLDDAMATVNTEKQLQNVLPGDFVIVKPDAEKISRAFVIELKDAKFRVAMIDYAQIIEVDMVYELPNELKSFDEFTCICQAPLTYVKDLVIDDAKVMHSPANYKLIDTESKDELTCTRWIPEEYRKLNLENTIKLKQENIQSPTSPKIIKSLITQEKVVTNHANNNSMEITSTVVNLQKIQTYPCGKAFIQNMGGINDITIQILNILSPTTFVAFIICAKSLTLEDAIASTIEKQLQNVKPGSSVIVKPGDEKVSRGFVLELKGNKFRVAMIDYAEVIEVDKVYEISEELKNYEEYTCICIAPTDYVKNLNVDDPKMMNSPENYKLIDCESKVEIKCERWMPEEFYKPNESLPVVPKPEQKIYMSIPTDELSINITDKVLLNGYSDGFFYLRTRDMHGLIKTMNNKIQDVEALEKPPKLGQYVLHKTTTGEWRRAIVKKILNNKACLDYIDYFQSNDIVPITDIYNLPQVALFGATIFKRRLKSFDYKNCSQKALDKINEYISQKFIIIYHNQDEIDFKSNPNDPLSMSEILIQLDALKIKKLVDLPKVDIEYNQLIQVAILHNEEDFFVFAPVKESSEYLEKIMSLPHMESSPQLETIVVGQLCVALFDGEWYRGEIKSLNGNKMQVYFIDFGNTDVVEQNNIKEIPEEMLTIPVFAFKGITSPDSVCPNQPSAGETFLANIKKKIGEVNHVELLEKL